MMLLQIYKQRLGKYIKYRAIFLLVATRVEEEENDEE